jgi:signal transduction histidine kinase
MTLRQKTLFIIGLIFAMLVLLLFFLVRSILLSSYDELQTRSTREHLQRAINTLEREVNRFAISVDDYARWDDSLAFVQGELPEYADDNLASETFLALQVNFMLFTDTTGQVVFSKGFDREANELPLPPGIAVLVAQTPALYAFQTPAEHVEGFVTLPEGLAIIAAAPIRTSADTPPIGGSLIWVRWLDTDEIAALSEITQLSIHLFARQAPDLPEDFRTALQQLEANPEPLFRSLGNERSAGYALLNDIGGVPAMILRVDTPRSIGQQGEQSTLYFMLALLVLGAAAVIAAVVLIERLVLARLAALSEDVRHISKTKSVSDRVKVTGNDELATLETEINKMLAAIQEGENELRVAKDAAEQSNRAKNTFLANMSHELRTPLNAIMGFVSIMLMNGKLDPKDEYRAQRAYTNSERLLNTINDILDISRIEAGRLQMVMSPVNVRETISMIKNQMDVLAEEKTLPLNLQIHDNVPQMIETDSEALTKIITNLISNGIKFTEKGSVSVDVQAHDMQLIIKVSDTGIGIAPHMHDLIFERFRQVDDSSTRPYGGVGLGLAIVQNMCQALHGSVRVESVLGQGSTFIVTLPFARVQQEVV